MFRNNLKVPHTDAGKLYSKSMYVYADNTHSMDDGMKRLGKSSSLLYLVTDDEGSNDVFR